MEHKAGKHVHVLLDVIGIRLGLVPVFMSPSEVGSSRGLARQTLTDGRL